MRETVVDVGGRRLRMTNLDKVMYPQTGTTKAEVAQYYVQIAPFLLPHAAGRPVTRKRWVDGVGTARRPREAFFSKDLDAGTPSWVVRAPLQHSDHVSTYPVADSVATLAWFAQIAALELHVPQWRLDSAGAPANPDRLVLDLDPGPGVDLATVARVATWVRDILTGMGLAAFPVTSGSKGVHLYAPLDGTVTSEQTSALARELARSLEADHPELVLSRMKRSAREGRVFLDWSQNNAKKTTVLPYSLRGTALPRVAAPRTWAELEDPQVRQLTPEEVLALVAQRGDPLAALGSSGGDLPDRLSAYRAKRNSARTPEPVPDSVGSAGRSEVASTAVKSTEVKSTEVQSTGPVSGDAPAPLFVIQEHHASRLHWDLRLERDGVLVSWALPRGVPTSPDRNNLAVPTEDHPMEYADFSGTIPAGEYGAGDMTIWDRGTYRLEKWREGAEVIVTLTGSAGGGLATSGPGRQSRFALIRTGEDRWLIHLMKPKSARLRAHGTVHTPSRSPTAPGPPGDVTSPMLAKPGTLQDLTDGDWSGEMKWDGVRALLHVDGGEVRIFGRSGLETTDQYPELAALSESVHATSAVLDGEIVALDSAGRPDFALLQPRMHASGAQVKSAVRAQPVALMLFDVLSMDGHDLTGMSYAERRSLLGDLIEQTDVIQVPPTFDGDLHAALAASAEQGLEGIVAKRRSSTYSPGHRSSAWIKIRHARAQEVVIVGWRTGRGARAATFGSLLMAVPDGEGGWRYAGRVGTGFSERQSRAWFADLRAEEIDDPPIDGVPLSDSRDAHWVRPERVAEVTFANWTPSGRLRHPVWRGWRKDKSPQDLTADEEHR